VRSPLRACWQRQTRPGRQRRCHRGALGKTEERGKAWRGALAARRAWEGGTGRACTSRLRSSISCANDNSCHQNISIKLDRKGGGQTKAALEESGRGERKLASASMATALKKIQPSKTQRHRKRLAAISENRIGDAGESGAKAERNSASAGRNSKAGSWRRSRKKY